MTPTLLERLGRPPDARLLITTSDDLGFTHSVNAAFVDGVARGWLTSGSVMVPCPWFAEIAAVGRGRPDVSLGIHLTLTCETDAMRWGPLLGDAVPSLRDADGGFPRTEAEVLARADLAEIEAELLAQIERARAAGLRPTHIDSHMGVLYQRPDVYELLLRIGASERMPVRHPREWMAPTPHLDAPPGPGVLHNDHLRSVGMGVDAAAWRRAYLDHLTTLPPGVTELVLHVGHDDDELRAAYGDMEDWGAAWRQRDRDIAVDQELADLLDALGVERIGWSTLAALLQPDPGA